MTIHHLAHELGLSADFTMAGAVEHYPPSLELVPVQLDIALQVDVKARAAWGSAAAPSSIAISSPWSERWLRAARSRSLAASASGTFLTERLTGMVAPEWIQLAPLWNRSRLASTGKAGDD